MAHAFCPDLASMNYLIWPSRLRLCQGSSLPRLVLAKADCFDKTLVLPDQAWQASHPPKRGRHFLRSRPSVHNGFLKSYLANGLKEAILKRLLEIIACRTGTDIKVTHLKTPTGLMLAFSP